MDRSPQYLNLDKIGNSSLGFITVAENLKNIPFEIKRVYWTYFTPQDIIRGGHAHKNLEQIIFAVSGTIEFNTEDKKGNKETFILNNPSKGIYLPKLVWRDIKFSHNAVLLCLASELYYEDDYFRDYEDFKKYQNSLELKLVSYTEDILIKSWKWLNDPEIKKLTGTPDFTKETQKKWFNNIEKSDDYYIQGLSLNGKIIGAAGLKKINSKSKDAEYFGYIGEKEYWGQGLSKSVLHKISILARDLFNLNSLYLNVSTENTRAIRAYENLGFRVDSIEKDNIKMSLKL